MSDAETRRIDQRSPAPEAGGAQRVADQRGPIDWLRDVTVEVDDEDPDYFEGGTPSY